MSEASEKDPTGRLFSALLEIRDEFAANPNVPVLHFLEFCARNMSVSKSQLFQDLFALFFTNSKRNGFFVEFGAADGVNLSNSYLLEKNHGWTGILADPAKRWHDKILKARSAVLETRCIWKRSGERLQFRETAFGELSTIEEFSNMDDNRFSRVNGELYEVETISLNDMLEVHRCPRDIDYMSVDTEGSELEILSAFDFSKHSIKLMTVEHNFTDNRAKIRKLLAAQGFISVLDSLSSFDDWFVRQDVLQAMEKHLGLRP